MATAGERDSVRSGNRRRGDVVVLLGLPGAGKGTQAAELATKFGYAHVSTGNLFREVVAARGAMAGPLRAYIDSGEMIPDAITTELLFDHLARLDNDRALVIDGFPRTVVQAEALDRNLGAGRADCLAIFIEASEVELIRRLSGRRICSAFGHPYQVTEERSGREIRCDLDGSPLIRREDDEPTVVSRRLAQQAETLTDILTFYERRGCLRRVDGERSASTVTEAILGAIGRVATAGGSQDAGWIHPDRGWILGIPPDRD